MKVVRIRVTDANGIRYDLMPFRAFFGCDADTTAATGVRYDPPPDPSNRDLKRLRPVVRQRAEMLRQLNRPAWKKR